MKKIKTLSFVEFLAAVRSELKRRQRRNTLYSMRAFARDLGVSHATLGRLLRSDSVPTFSIVRKIAEQLGVLVSDIPKPRSEDGVPFEILPATPIEGFGYFFHFSILAMAELPKFDSAPAAISKRLQCSKNIAQIVLEDLVANGCLERSKSGKVRASGKGFASAVKPANIEGRLFVLARMQDYVKNLNAETWSKSEFSEMYIAASSKNLEATRQRIRTFRRTTAKAMERGSKDTVYILGTYLMPLT